VKLDAFGAATRSYLRIQLRREEPHALVMVWTTNAGGLLRGRWGPPRSTGCLERLPAGTDTEDGGRTPARPRGARSRPPQERRLLETELAVTEPGRGPPADDSFAPINAYPGPDPHAAPPAPG